MKVWVVEKGYDYEGFDIDSIWLTYEEANNRRMEIEKNKKGNIFSCDYVDIEEIEVGKYENL